MPVSTFGLFSTIYWRPHIGGRQILEGGRQIWRLGGPGLWPDYHGGIVVVVPNWHRSNSFVLCTYSSVPLEF
jgi:hypothetical protein